MTTHVHASRVDPIKWRRELDMANKRRREMRQLNPEKARAKDKIVYLSRPENWRKRARLRKYKISSLEWDIMFEAQERRCANPGCCSDTPGGKMHWCTDHDHKTGEVRGILCHQCNRMLGHSHDDSNRLLGGAKYLEERRGGPNVG